MNAVAQKPKDIAKAASKSLASEHRLRKAALQPVAAAAEIEFARGRDIALSMLAEADTLGDEREAWRRTRSGRMQDNFFKGYIADIIEEPALMDGFAAVLSATLRNDHMDLSELASLTLAETQEGVVGQDGTIADSDHAEVSATSVAVVVEVAKDVSNDQVHSPACLVTEGVVVLRCAALELNSPMVWGLHSLSKVVSAAATKAWDDVSPPDEELLNDVSAQLDELLSLLAVVNNDGLDCMLLYAAKSLLNAAKMMIDAKCEELV